MCRQKQKIRAVNMNKIGKRLEVIASLVNKKRIADVGCDHGKLAYYLLENAIVDYAIVSDISMPSLNKAIDILSKTKYNFDYICCDGLTGYKGYNIDQCIIAGMGGDEIIKIISNSPINISSYILSPQHNNVDVKKFMLGLGYDIDYDIIVKENNKFYNIFRCKKKDILRTYSDYELIIGKDNSNSISDAREFVEKEIQKIENILSNNKIPNSKLEDYLNILKTYK